MLKSKRIFDIFLSAIDLMILLAFKWNLSFELNAAIHTQESTNQAKNIQLSYYSLVTIWSIFFVESSSSDVENFPIKSFNESFLFFFLILM